MGIKLPDARSLSDEVLGALRLRALRGCEMGLTEWEVGSLLGVSRETVSRWWSAYAEGGVGALPDERTGRPTGSGRTLSFEQGERIQSLIDANSPEDLGIAAPLWSRRAVRDLIAKECGVTMPARTVGEYLKRWGYTAKRPTRHAKDQDAEEVREWLEEDYPDLARQAKEENAEIFFCDEVGVAADEHPRTAYAREGQPAVMEVPAPHIRVNVVSAVNNKGDFHFMTYTRSMNAAVFITFLELLVRQANKKVFLLVDHLSAHDCEAVEDWLAKHTGEIRLVFLPRRAPELNPDEYFNNDLKGNVHDARLPNTKEELLDQVTAFLDKLCRLPERIISYFHHPSAQYAAAS
jgi:transposase